MNNFNSEQVFVYLVFPISIIVFGLIGNTTGLLVLFKKKMKKIGPRNTFSYLLMMDSFYLIQIIIPLMEYGFKIQISRLSNAICKAYNFLNYSLDTQSAMLLVYITADRLLSFKHPSIAALLRKEKTQLAYFLLIMAWNLVWYSPIAFYYKLMNASTNNSINQTSNLTLDDSVCYFTDLTSQNVLGYMDMGNRVILPFLLMIIFTSVLIDYIFQSRRRIRRNKKSNDNKESVKDIKFAVTSIALNIIYILFSLPVSIVVLFPDYYFYISYAATLYLFYAGYAVNFYILLFTNSLFRRETLALLKLNSYFSKGNRPTNTFN